MAPRLVVPKAGPMVDLRAWKLAARRADGSEHRLADPRDGCWVVRLGGYWAGMSACR